VSDPWLIDVEAYVLGCLDEPERTAFEEHLGSCLTCRAAVDEVGVLPALLDLIPPDLVAQIADQDPVTAAVPRPAAEQVPSSVLAGLLWSARREGALRRRRRLVAGALAVAVVVILALVVPASPIGLVGRSTPPSGQEFVLDAVAPSAVTASVSLTQVAWGTRIELECSYASAGPSGPYSSRVDYALVVVADDGSSEQVATWVAVPGRTITVPAASDQLLSRITSIRLLTSDGRTILKTDL